MDEQPSVHRLLLGRGRGRGRSCLVRLRVGINVRLREIASAHALGEEDIEFFVSAASRLWEAEVGPCSHDCRGAGPEELRSLVSNTKWRAVEDTSEDLLHSCLANSTILSSTCAVPRSGRRCSRSVSRIPTVSYGSDFGGRSGARALYCANTHLIGIASQHDRLRSKTHGTDLSHNAVGNWANSDGVCELS